MARHIAHFIGIMIPAAFMAAGIAVVFMRAIDADPFAICSGLESECSAVAEGARRP